MWIKMAWRAIQYRFLPCLTLMIMIALAVGLSIFVLSLSQGIQKGLTKATAPFDLLVGAKGSDNQLVLNTVFLQDKPIGNIPYSIVKEMEGMKDKVQLVVPLAFGDNYRGFRIVGTTNAIFQYPLGPHEPSWLSIAKGRAFTGEKEAVLGAETARMSGLTIGDTFQSIHGLSGHIKIKSAVHQDGYRVVGILAPLQGPYDQAILVPLSSVWHSHHIQEGKEEVTAMMIKPTGYKEALQLYQGFQKRKDSQMVFPAQVIVRLFAMMGQGEKIWNTLTMAIIVMTIGMVLFVTYWAGLYRRRELAIMKSLGASTTALIKGMVMENGLLIFLGTMLGWGFGTGAYALVGTTLVEQTAIRMTWEWNALILAVLVGTMLLGILGSILPAWLLSRKEVHSYL